MRPAGDDSDPHIGFTARAVAGADFGLLWWEFDASPADFMITVVAEHIISSDVAFFALSGTSTTQVAQGKTHSSEFAVSTDVTG